MCLYNFSHFDWTYFHDDGRRHRCFIWPHFGSHLNPTLDIWCRGYLSVAPRYSLLSNIFPFASASFIGFVRSIFHLISIVLMRVHRARRCDLIYYNSSCFLSFRWIFIRSHRHAFPFAIVSDLIRAMRNGHTDYERRRCKIDDERNVDIGEEVKKNCKKKKSDGPVVILIRLYKRVLTFSGK